MAAAPDQIYLLAHAAAGYRERNVSHEEILKIIAQGIQIGALRLRILRGQRGIEKLYEDAILSSREIRQHPLNSEQPERQ